jgi:protein ImuA
VARRGATRREGHDLGDPRWRLQLLRCRGGRPGGPWPVVWRAAAGVLERDAEDDMVVQAACR